MLERAVYYEKLSPGSVAELAALSRELGADALVKVNQKAYELAEQDKSARDASERISFGVYFFTGPDDGQDGGK